MTSMIDLQVTELVGKSKYLYLITKWCKYRCQRLSIYCIMCLWKCCVCVLHSRLIFAGLRLSAWTTTDWSTLWNCRKAAAQRSPALRVFWVGVFRGVSNCPSGIIKRIWLLKRWCFSKYFHFPLMTMMCINVSTITHLLHAPCTWGTLRNTGTNKTLLFSASCCQAAETFWWGMQQVALRPARQTFPRRVRNNSAHSAPAAPSSPPSLPSDKPAGDSCTGSSCWSPAPHPRWPCAETACQLSPRCICSYTPLSAGPSRKSADPRSFRLTDAGPGTSAGTGLWWPGPVCGCWALPPCSAPRSHNRHCKTPPPRYRITRRTAPAHRRKTATRLRAGPGERSTRFHPSSSLQAASSCRRTAHENQLSLLFQFIQAPLRDQPSEAEME